MCELTGMYFSSFGMVNIFRWCVSRGFSKCTYPVTTRDDKNEENILRAQGHFYKL